MHCASSPVVALWALYGIVGETLGCEASLLGRETCLEALAIAL